ncbi:Tyrosine kinase receptor [Apis cerana cerana]|uniref:receptor protein-tyrosine kinase n=1 Tax=Apis cerana cerana TaxID=94128 RepID=A0A2A3EJ15_APICC|nr:Tyrosine kinase receptor [Apis cerana cerana]
MVVRGGIPSNSVIEIKKHRLDDHKSSIGDHRQGRMSLQAELPSSKAKREQALRSILAARRRQIFSQRPISESRNLNRTPRPLDASAKDASVDVLEAQETRHGMYVTAAAGKPGDEETSGRVIDGGEATSNVDIEFVSRDEERGKRVVEQSSTGKTGNEDLSIGDKSSLSPSTTSFSSLVPNQKSSDTETRGRNTVPMPESLYNYFRPVESNIPVEDMSQFLYFGQKIQPEIQNGTGSGSNNNTAESTATAPTAANSRRRYSMKRNSTTPVPVARLEEMLNEEMNIAVERQTVEKNKVSKMKNAFRGAENGVYYRKARPAETTIASNPRRERGSAAAHVAGETWNATNSTQIPSGQPVSAITRERNGAESETKLKDRPTDASNKSKPVLSSTVNGVENAKPSKVYPRKRKSNDPSSPAAYLEDEVAFSNPRESLGMDGSAKEERGIDEANYRTTVVACRESNNIETSTSREKLLGRSSTEPFRVVWTSPETSTLRIVVTEGRLGQGSADEYTVKPVVDSTEGRARGLDVLATPSTLAGSSGAEGARWKGRHREQKQQHHGRLDEGSGVLAREHERDRDPRHREEEQQHQQQHVYAYTITNVTRLLRNYTGPGLSREEQGGREASTAPAELSAGTTVEPAAAGGEASAHLVGERQRKVVVAVGAHQSQQQRAVNRAQLQLTAVNKSGPRSAKTAEAYHPRGGVRWSRAKPRSTEIEGLNDRRFLRKSASAVLNQRIGAGPEGEEDGAVAGKRRRLTNGQSQKRVKGTRNVDEDSDTVKNESGSIAGDERNSRVGARVEDVTIANGSGEGTILENATTVDTTSGGTMQQRVSSAPSVETETVLDSTGGGGGGDGGSGGPLPTAVNATTTDEGGSSEQAEASVVVPSTSTRGIGKSGADNGTENGSGSPTVTVTAASDETIVAKETTAPAPVFPVTPRMIAKAARDPIETFTSKPTEAPNQIADTKTVAGLVDPSVDTEKVYESKDRGITTMTTTASATASSSIATTEASTTTTTATTATTTVTTSLPTVQIEISTIAQDQSATTTTDSKEPRPLEDASPSILTADLADGRRGSGERSPEVRGRNLSDKSQDASTDKDDVLPIMHLYNTSDIFNNTGPVNPFSRGTERRAEHPLPAKQPSEPSRTTEKTSDTITPRSAENWTRGPDTRKDRHEESNQVPATGPGRGSSTSNGSGNRTRHRTVYHHPILPEYNTSVYPSELNRTLFETGLISVSPRESVNISEVISKRHDGDAIASQETVAVVSYILATLVVFPIAVGVGLILRRLILRNRKVLEESDTSSEISCRKDALNLENGDFKTSIEKAITKLPRIQHLCHEAEKPPPPSSQESRWEFPRDKLRLQTVLGQGNFGQVWKAEADDLTGHQGTTRLVAVKTVKEGASDREKEDLVRELEIMQQLGSHPNVVTLLGCCTEQEPHYLILEYVMYGKLLAYLRDHRTRQDFYNFSEDSAALTSRDLTVFGYCVARGMEYLASKKIIHRDLAARNVLVDHNKLCKIADFGMSRFADGDGEVIETRHGRNALPIRWMAPESLIYSLFTTKTDVWSFGILMWEIVTLGSTPYPDMTAREVMRNVQNGYRLERPSHCRSELFRVISRCWHADPDRRPEFQTLRRDLAQLLEDNMNGHYVDLESFASECTD